jgi:uncharacterized protein (TIGR03663 family)
MMNSRLVWGLFAAVCLAFALRIPQLDGRPMHTDESVHAIKFQGLWERGSYKYDPNEYHGPSLYYATLPVVWMSHVPSFAQSRESLYRFVPILFGVGLILLLGLVVDGQGRGAVFWAALFTAISPAMVFYSRYFIHEMPFIFFTFLLMAAAWRYSRNQRLGWMILAGVALGLMQATKETFVFNLAAMVPAAGLAWWLERRRRMALCTAGRTAEQMPSIAPFAFKPVHWFLGILAAAIVSVTLFSSFFTNAAGPLDSVRTYLPWLNRAGGQSPHIHPWYYYLELLGWTHRSKNLVWSEGLIMALAAIGLLAAFLRKGLEPKQVPWVRFIAIYTLLLTAAYSVIAYKTPWCLLGFWHGFILLAGVGAAVLIRWFRPMAVKVIIVLMILVATTQLAGQACRAAFVYSSDPRNPYVYAHTLPDLVEMADKIAVISQADPRGAGVPVKIMAAGGDYWPLPWYLRGFTNVGYYADVPDDPKAAIIVNSPQFSVPLDARLTNDYADAGLFGHRPAVFLQLRVEKGLWNRYLEAKSKPVAGVGSGQDK